MRLSLFAKSATFAATGLLTTPGPAAAAENRSILRSRALIRIKRRSNSAALRQRRRTANQQKGGLVRPPSQLFSCVECVIRVQMRDDEGGPRRSEAGTQRRYRERAGVGQLDRSATPLGPLRNPPRQKKSSARPAPNYEIQIPRYPSRTHPAHRVRGHARATSRGRRRVCNFPHNPQHLKRTPNTATTAALRHRGAQQLHRGTYDRAGDVGQTLQFTDATADNLFKVTAEPYTDLDLALGAEAPAGSASDQPDTLGIVHLFRNDLLEFTFVKNAVSYVVQTLPENATSTLDILTSWEFI
jgi:hypothetical protein